MGVKSIVVCCAVSSCAIQSFLYAVRIQTFSLQKTVQSSRLWVDIWAHIHTSLSALTSQASVRIFMLCLYLRLSHSVCIFYI